LKRVPKDAQGTQSVHRVQPSIPRWRILHRKKKKAKLDSVAWGFYMLIIQLGQRKGKGKDRLSGVPTA